MSEARFALSLAAITGGNPQGLITLADPLTFYYVKEIATFAAEQRPPSMYRFREFCNAGGLLCYGTNLSRQISRYGYFIDNERH